MPGHMRVSRLTCVWVSRTVKCDHRLQGMQLDASSAGALHKSLQALKHQEDAGPHRDHAAPGDQTDAGASVRCSACKAPSLVALISTQCDKLALRDAAAFDSSAQHLPCLQCHAAQEMRSR